MQVIRRTIILIYTFTLLGSILWNGLVFLAPYLKSQSHPLGPLIHSLFSPLCHQVDSRCFFLFGYPLAVCARCLGIYFGFLTGIIAYPVSQNFKTVTLPENKYLVLATFPIGLDVAGNLFSLWSTGLGLRFLSGFIWGSILPFYFMPGLVELVATFYEFVMSKHTHKP